MDNLPSRIQARAALAGLSVDAQLSTRLAEYLALLAKWNRRINLTALAVDPPSDDAIDRLLLEPVAGARWVRASDVLAVDIGSGGGSPAIPLKVTMPSLRMVLVESKVRKCAFLREAGRVLGLHGFEVENRRFEEVTAREDLRGCVDVVTVRAVRADAELWTSIAAILRPGGRVLWFGAATTGWEGVSSLAAVGDEVLVGSTGSRLGVVDKLVK